MSDELRKAAHKLLQRIYSDSAAATGPLAVEAQALSDALTDAAWTSTHAELAHAPGPADGPVAWRWWRGGVWNVWEHTDVKDRADEAASFGRHVEPLYTHPAPAAPQPTEPTEPT